MEQLKITVTIEDVLGVVFRETVETPRDELIVPGMDTPGMLPVAEALLKIAQTV